MYGSPTRIVDRQPNLLLYYPDRFGLDEWRAACERGERPEPSHWGMHHTARAGFSLSGTTDRESESKSLIGKALFGLLRLDFDHVWHNRDRIRHSDIVWTMSERELLAVAVTDSLFGRRRPILVSEVCYLLDEWPGMRPLRRLLLRWALRRADCILAVSEDVAAQVEELQPKARVETYRFGVPIEALQACRHETDRAGPLRLLMPGNDLRRDWETAAKAVERIPNVELTMLTKHDWVKSYASDKVEVAKGRDFRDLIRHYGQCDAVLIASKANRHGAGLTMMLEAAAIGIPLIVTRDATLEEYLDSNCALFVEPGDVGALSSAIRLVRSKPEGAAKRAEAARRKLVENDWSSEGAASRRAAIILQVARANMQLRKIRWSAWAIAKGRSSAPH